MGTRLLVMGSPGKSKDVCVCVGLSSAEAFPAGTDSQRQSVCSAPCRNKSFIPEI